MAPESISDNRVPKETTSAGGVVLRSAGGEIEFLIGVRTTDVEPKWAPVLRQLPKGVVRHSESLENAALREVSEETGYAGTIHSKAGIARWTYERAGTYWRETVHYYVMTTATEIPQGHDHAFNEVLWIPLRRAADTLSYPEEREIVCNLKEDALSKLF